MADLNALIAQGYQFQPLPDPFAQYGKMQQLQNAGIQNQLTQQQLTAAQRAEAQTNVENQAYANAVNPDTGEIDYAKVRQALASGNAGAQIPKLEQARLAAKKAGLETQKLEGEINAQPVALAGAKSKVIDEQLKRSKELLDRINPNDPNVRGQLMAWHQGNHTGYLGELLKSQGSTPEKTMADIDAAVAAGPKGISDFIGRSVEGTQAFQKKIAPMPKEVSNGKEKFLRDENPLSPTYMQEIPGSRTTLQMSPYETDHLQFLKDKEKFDQENPGFELTQQTQRDGSIKTVKVNKRTGVASDVEYGGSALTGVSVPILDLNFRINKENYERANPGVTVHKRTLPNGDDEIIAIDKQGVVRPITFGAPSSTSQVSLSSLSPPVANNLPVVVAAAPANALPAAITSEAAPAVDPAVAEARAALAAARAALVSAPAAAAAPALASAPAAAAPAPASVVQNAMYSGGNNNAMNTGGLISYKRPVSEIEQYEYAKTPAGGNFKGTLAEFKVLAKPTAEIEQYEYAKRNGYTGTFEQFKVIAKPTAEIEQYEYAKKNGYKGTFEQFKVLSTPKTTVSVSNVQEREEAKKYGEFLVDDYKAVKTLANQAVKSIPAIESNLAILNKGFDTGSFTESKAAAAKVLGALGVKDAEQYAADSQAFLANANAAVLQKQLEQKGPQTEADAQRITQTGAQLGNTKAANEFVLKVAKAQLQRDVEQRDFYAAWRDKNQTFNGAENAWSSGPGNKSLFERPELKPYAAGPNVKEVAPDRTKRLDQIFGGKR
jgi:hypothetical protein